MTYCVTEFRVTNSGHYTFSLDGATPVGDCHTLLYEDAFDPSSPVDNVLTGNDCARTGRSFSYSLSSGKHYFFVVVSASGQTPDPHRYAIRGAGSVVHLAASVGMRSEPMEQTGVSLAVLLATARRKSASQSLGRPSSLLFAVQRGVQASAGNVQSISSARPPALVLASAPARASEPGPAAARRASDDYLPLRSFLRVAG